MSWSSTRSRICARAASTIIWAAIIALLSTTSAGWCPISRRCCYNNAQLLRTPRARPCPQRQRPVPAAREETVEWLAREMTTREGAFCLRLRCDSEGEEGEFFVWSRAEIEDILGPRDAEFFALTYDVTPGGNFEGHNILNRLASLGEQKTKLQDPGAPRIGTAPTSPTNSYTPAVDARRRLPARATEAPSRQHHAARRAAADSFWRRADGSPASTTRCWRTGTG